MVAHNNATDKHAVRPELHVVPPEQPDGDIAPVPEGIPRELRERPQWVVHREGAPYAVRNTSRRNGRAWGKGKKVDYTDPNKLAAFAEAWEMYLAGGWDGIGYCILASDPFLLVDIDGCVRPDGSLAPTVHYWVQRLGGYVERSPSQQGVHVLVQARLPRPGSVYWLREGSLHETFKVEVYDQTRFVRMTGVPLPGRALGEIADRHSAVDAFIAALAPEGTKGRRQTKTNGHSAAEPPERISPPLDDAEVLAKARSGRYGATFGPLYDHGASDNLAWIKDPSESGLDHFMVNELVYWTQDVAQIERLMRRSALERPKWDEHHHGPSNPPYLEELILDALAKKERHWGDGLGANTPQPTGQHDDAAPADPPPSSVTDGDAQQCEMQAWKHLAQNAYLSAPERGVLPALVALAGYRMGQRLPERVPIGFIKPQVRAASGVCARYWEAALPRLADRGIVTRVRHPSESHPGRRWYWYTLIGTLLNDGGLETVGQQRKQGRPLAAKKRPPVRRAALDAQERRELEELRAENADLRTALRRARACSTCGSLLTVDERACDACRPHTG
jgi:hypothetical protein